MKKYQREFITLAINKQVLQFGKFQLKSGRVSPYFFNAGLFNTGRDLAQLGHFYAAALQNCNVVFDVLFGPAYKGIPMVTAAAIALAEQYDREIGYCFNRKEIKNHGEGGQLVGSVLHGRIMLVDDVITAGTAIHESMKIIHAHGASLAGIIILLDRQERGKSKLSAIEEVKERYQCPVISIITLSDLIDYLAEQPDMAANLTQLSKYYEQYGVAL